MDDGNFIDLRTTDSNDREDIAQLVKAGDVEALLSRIRSARERGFRRGYRHGWVKAIDNLHDQQVKYRRPFQEAYETCWRHWTGELLQGTQGNRGYFAPDVPAPTVSTTKE